MLFKQKRNVIKQKQEEIKMKTKLKCKLLRRDKLHLVKMYSKSTKTQFKIFVVKN